MSKIETLHSGLTQKSYLEYSLEDGKRVSGSDFVRTVMLNLPLFLTIDVWRRHGYTLSDVKTTLEYFSSVLLWQYGLLHGIVASNSAIKVSFSTPESMVYGSKAIVIRKISKLLVQEYGLHNNKPSVLDTIREDHVPPIPLHTLNKKKWNDLYKMLPENANLMRQIKFSTAFEWKDILLVPLWLEKGAIYTIRIVPYEVFAESQRDHSSSLSNKPYDIWVDEKQFCGLEEACFFEHNR